MASMSAPGVITADEYEHLEEVLGWKTHDPASGMDSVPGPDLMVIREEDARRAIKDRRWLRVCPCS